MATERNRNSSPEEPPSARAQRELAIRGGVPSFPEGPPVWPLPDPEIDEIVLAALRDGSWGQYRAAHSAALITKLRDLHAVEHVLTCCSGTLAVELALRGLQVGAGDEVVLAGYDFPGNFRAIEAVGAFPVLVDIDPKSWCLEPTEIAAAITPRSRAVIVSHLHGGVADMRQITEMARTHRLVVVEDACQAPGACVQGRVAGTWGDVGVLSFGGSKLLTAGRGGALLTTNASVYQRAKIYGERGNDAFPLSELQAAVLLPQLEKLAHRNRLRGEHVGRLRSLCDHLAWLRCIALPTKGDRPSYYKVAFCCDSPPAGVDRSQFIAAMQAEGVAIGTGFRGFVRRGPKRCRRIGSLPHCAYAADHTVLLHHPALLQSVDYVQRVAQTLEKVAHALSPLRADSCGQR